MIATRWERRIMTWWPSDDREKKATLEMRRMGEKNSHNRKQLWEDGIKLELCIFGRTGKDLRGTLLWSSKSENDNEKHHHELFRHSGRIKNEEVEPTVIRIWQILEKYIWLMIIHSYVKLGEEFESNSVKEKSQVRSWEKTCGLGPTQKKTPLNDFEERLHRLN